MENKFFIGIGIITVILIIAGYLLVSKQEEGLNKALMGQKIPIQGAQHVPRNQSHADYNSNPPTSGPHWGDGTAGAGAHDKEVPDELLVHSLEHGGVIVSYKPDLTKDQIGQITNAYDEASGKKILIPRKNLNVPVAVTSWGRIIKFKAIDKNTLSQIKAFIESNSGKGPENAPI